MYCIPTVLFTPVYLHIYSVWFSLTVGIILCTEIGMNQAREVRMYFRDLVQLETNRRHNILTVN